MTKPDWSAGVSKRRY